jgi:NAD(P)-dependent dehydrogenase (short-subunit alcohol dehydrogenase family)
LTDGSDDALRRLFGLHGKVAVVTGGGQGIGRMLATGLLEAGASVVLASRKLDVCEATAAELGALGPVHALQADLSTTAGCLALAEQLRERAPRIHVLVNNAGATWGAPLDEFPDAAWDRSFDLNVRAVFTLTRALVPQLRAAATPGDPARVVNVGSIDGLHVPALETYAYAASKAALHHLTRVLARRLGPEGIAVNALAPGPFESKMMHATLEAFGDELAASSPLGRIGQPDDMAGAIVYLASRAAAYVTGAVLPVDGGIVTTL